MSSLLIVEDDVTIREMLFDLLSEEHSCFQTNTAEEALKILESEQINVVLTDISMPGMSGLELLGHTRQRWPSVEVIMISGIRDREYASGLVRMGAFDYLAKPFNLDDIKSSVDRAAEKSEHGLKGQPAIAESVAEVGEVNEKPVEVFSAIQLDKAFPLHELLEMSQRNRMTGYIKLSWDEKTKETARSMEMFKELGVAFEEALESQCAFIYLRDGLMIDAVVMGSEKSIYSTNGEEALSMIIRLATWVNVGVCASGYTVANLMRPERLSVSSNSGKFLSIVASEETHDQELEEQPVAEVNPKQLESSPDLFYLEATSMDGDVEKASGSDSGSNKSQEDTHPKPQELTTQ
ncbi:MAG: response regulator [Pyrinomonadaceae bacterium]